MAKQYPIRVVSRMTGVSLDTIRAWERRYKVVKPDRSARGRLYDEADVQRFMQLRFAVGKGYSISEVAALPEEELNALISAARQDVPMASPPRDSTPQSRIDAVLAAVETFDSARVNEELGRLAALLSPVDFVHQVALPLMRETGDRWHAGTLQTAHEHMVTEIVRDLLGAMARLNRPADALPGIVATTPAGELHDLAVLAATVLAGVRAFPVAYLGPNLPAEQILFAVRKFEPQVLLLGLTTPEPVSLAVDTVRAVAAGLPPDVELWLGGVGAQALACGQPSSVTYIGDLNALERNLSRIQRLPSTRNLP